MPTALFLRITGIAGGSLDKDHRDWIELISLDGGLAQTGGSLGGGAGGGAGKVVARPLTVAALTSIATPLVFEAVAKGTRFTDGTLESVRPGETHAVLMRMDLEDLSLVSLDLSGADEGLLDRYGIVARRIRISYFAQDPKGGIAAPVTRGWDFAAHRAW